MATDTKLAPGTKVTATFEGIVTSDYVSGDRVGIKVDGSSEHFCAPPSAVTVLVPVEPDMHSVTFAGNDKFIRIFDGTDGWRWVMPGGGLGTVKYTWEKIVRLQRNHEKWEAAQRARKAQEAKSKPGYLSYLSFN